MHQTRSGNQNDNPRVRPLAGLRVLDLTRYIAGPFCGQMLADAGAEVIKVEPVGGESSRFEPPRVALTEDREESALFLRFNRGKKSVTLDTRTSAGKEKLKVLIADADVLLENFRPGMLESWGLGWEALRQLNPRLIYASISGFGYENSPLRDVAVFNTIAEARGGLVSEPPTNCDGPKSMGLPLADGVSGLYSTIGILQAVIERQTTGLGSRVDLAMYDAVLQLNDQTVANSSMASTRDADDDAKGPMLSPFGYFRAQDGWLVIGVVTDRQWNQLCDLAGWDDWARSDHEYQDRINRYAVRETVVRPRLEQWLSSQTRVEASQALSVAGVPAGPYQSGQEILRDDQARQRGMLLDYETADGGMTLVANPFGFIPADARGLQDFAYPGEHNDEILSTYPNVQP